MIQLAEQFHDILLDDIKGHPELITDILFDDDDVSLILEKRGKTVRFAYMRTNVIIASEKHPGPMSPNKEFEFSKRHPW